MTSRKRKRTDVRAMCAQWGPDDGVDPRDDARRTAAARQPNRKIMQLCKQVAQTLQLAIAALPQADVLVGVEVRQVLPAPNAARLRVVIVAPDGERMDAAAALVLQYAGRLRATVAEAISRRRAPELTFEFTQEGGKHG